METDRRNFINTFIDKREKPRPPEQSSQSCQLACDYLSWEIKRLTRQLNVICNVLSFLPEPVAPLSSNTPLLSRFPCSVLHSVFPLKCFSPLIVNTCLLVQLFSIFFSCRFSCNSLFDFLKSRKGFD